MILLTKCKKQTAGYDDGGPRQGQKTVYPDRCVVCASVPSYQVNDRRLSDLIVHLPWERDCRVHLIGAHAFEGHSQLVDERTDRIRRDAVHGLRDSRSKGKGAESATVGRGTVDTVRQQCVRSCEHNTESDPWTCREGHAV